MYTAAEMGKYSLSKKGMELERNFSLNLSSINPELSLETYKIFHPEIIERTGYGHMGLTQCHIHSHGRRYGSIYIQDSVTGLLKSGLMKLLNTTIQPES